jgi:hypothetical protein
MMTSWIGKHTFNENFKRGGEREERGERREREREREGEYVYTHSKNRVKGEGERDGMSHDSGIQRTNVI